MRESNWKSHLHLHRSRRKSIHNTDTNATIHKIMQTNCGRRSQVESFGWWTTGEADIHTQIENDELSFYVDVEDEQEEDRNANGFCYIAVPSTTWYTQQLTQRTHHLLSTDILSYYVYCCDSTIHSMRMHSLQLFIAYIVGTFWSNVNE